MGSNCFPEPRSSASATPLLTINGLLACPGSRRGGYLVNRVIPLIAEGKLVVPVRGRRVRKQAVQIINVLSYASRTS